MAGTVGPPPGSLAALLRVAQKRKVYFSFHFDDIMRVNIVRNAWKIDHPAAPAMRSFYDSSLWESRQLESPDSIKNIVRDGVANTSAVCVLVGSNTWSRRWVRYEVARAVIDGRGLLAVHVNSLRHHVRLQPDPWGCNPLACLAVGKVQPDPRVAPQYYLFEWTDRGWVRYQDHIAPVQLPTYLADPAAGYVMELSKGTVVYDYVNQQGHKYIGAWVDSAAQQVGR